MATGTSSPVRSFQAAGRLGAFDPFLMTARAIGVGLWGPGIGAAVTAAAMRFPTRIAIADGTSSVDYRTLDCQATTLAAHLRSAGRGKPVGVLARNHAGFILAQVAAERAGADVVLLSTALPAAKLAEVMEREAIGVLIADQEFRDLLEESGTDVTVLSADGSGPGTVEAVVATPRPCPPPARRSRLILLTSGTTGPPKGARRPSRPPSLPSLGLFDRIPYRLGDTYHVATPLFHAWGLSQATTAMATGSTLILRSKFDAAALMALLGEQHVDVLAVVPLILRRLLREPTPEGVHRPRIVASSGNVLPGDLAIEWMDRFGDRLYNLYGSTEAAIGTIASPAELRASPGTVGRPPRGVTLTILDDEAMPVPPGQSGRVFLSSGMQFSGYTDGSDGERAGTLLASGDLGYIDRTGLLHIDGRANDMIITGGENVFPSRVEEVLNRLPSVELSAVVGVDDEEFGQRVVAFVVPQEGATIDVDELRAATAAELQAFLVPKEFHVVDGLPMTTTGKVIRHGLAVLGDADHI